ncbi:MAG: hypothetical protein LBU92_00260 [Prevotellaceae bacterium]|jgi:hypothetical protein|nr:hypothetical protein [Prevotellaceae bacterium]
MLDINDPDYGSHHRAPYKIVEAANPDKVVATIYEPVGATFDMLPPEHQAAFRQEFDNFYNQYLNNAAAKQDFFSMQQGTVLAEKVEQLAAPKDGSFMLYIQNSRLYKASLHGVRITATQELLPGTSVSSVEVSPDGAYCVYQKTGNTGLFYASVASPAEKRLSSKRTCIAANMEAPKRFAKNAAGNWEYVFLSGANIYSVQITAVGAKEWVFAANVQNPSATPCLQQAFADDNNDVHYLQFSGKYGSADLYKVLKKNIDSPNTPAISYRSFFMECGAEGCSEVSLHAVSSRKAVLRQKYGSRFNYFALGRNRMEHLTSAADFQFSINPFMASCILSGSGNTHINSTNPDSAIVNGRVATNIGYSTSGNIMLYMDKLTGRVYKSFINQAAAKAELEELYRRYRWEQWIAQQLGTRVLLPNNIALGVHQWQLLDADGCVAEVAISTTQSRMNKSVPVTLTVTLTAPPTPNISYTITAQPTTGSGGTARISLVSGGTPPYRYGEQTLSQNGDQITVSNLQFGDNLVTFFDRDWNQSASINIHIAGKGVSTVAAAPQTSLQPNGSLSITTQGLSGSVAYTAELLSAPHTKYTRTIASSTCKIDGLPAGMYKVSVAQGGKTYSKNDGYEVASQIFSLKNIELMHAAKLSGTGSLRMEFANAAAGAACYLNGTNYAIKNGAVAANNLQAGKYAIRAVSGSSQLHDTVLVAAPEFWGTLRVSYRQNECRISTDEIFGNALFSGYEFRLKNENDSIVSSGKQLNLAVSSAQRYTLEVYNSVSNDAEKVGDIAPANAMQYRVSIAQPSCPYDSAAVGLAVQSGSFSTSSAGVEVSYNGGFDYGKVWKRTLAPSPSGRTEITALLRDSKVEQLGNLTLIRSLEQAVDTFFISPEEVIALPRREHVTCHGLSNGKIWLENLYGGSGSYRYKLNDGAWRSGSDTAFGLPPARYAVYLQDSKNLCRVVQLDSITVTEPEPLRIDSMLMLQPTCGYNNGLVAALVSGGNECYKAEWHYNGKPWSASNDDEDCTSNPYQVLSDSLDVGVYRVRVTDTYGCSATAEATLHEYRHSAITNFTVQNASCYNYDDGAIKFSVKEGDAPVKSIELWCADNLCGKTEGAKKAAFENLSAGTYRCVVRDTFGCTADTLVVVKQPDSLKIQAKVQPATIRYSVALSATGGSGSYAYRWSNGDTAAIVRSLPAGSYQVHVTDANRCAFETALELPKLSVDELIVYPNPTNGMLYIENHAAGDEVLLHDLVGALLLRSHSGVVDMSNLPAGLYLLRSKGKTVKVFKY